MYALGIDHDISKSRVHSLFQLFEFGWDIWKDIGYLHKQTAVVNFWVIWRSLKKLGLGGKVVYPWIDSQNYNIEYVFNGDLFE